MSLDKFIEDFFGNVMSEDGLNNIKDIIQKDMLDCGYKYNNTKVEYQIFDINENYDASRVEISSEGYEDGKIIFIDYHLD